MKVRKNTISTRKKIMEAAIQEFSRKGYRDTKITEICRLAGTNIGSVNYHFRDKETLYIEVWNEAFRNALEKHPPDGGVDEKAPAEERLRGRIAAMLNRAMDPSCYDFEIGHMEIVNPTGILMDIIKECFEPLENELVKILRELLGENARDEDIELSVMSIHAQCLNPVILCKRYEAGKLNSEIYHPLFLKAEPDKIVGHVINFSHGGIAEVRRYLENGK